MDSFSADSLVRSRMALRRVGWVWFCLAAALCSAQDVHPAVAPPSKWVNPLSFDHRSAMADAGAPTVWTWLLIDRQFNPLTDEQFCHQVGQVPAAAAVALPLTIQFDPGCQLLTLNWVRVWRGATFSNRLDPSKVQFSRLPSQPDQGLFGSNRIAVISLDDIQVGDVIDYAYSLVGSNPALEGKFIATLAAQLPEPAVRIVSKVLWPSSRKLYVQNLGASFRPTTLLKSNLTEFTWDFRNVPGLTAEPDTPSWYEPRPAVQLSEFKTWANVSAWASHWLQPTNDSSPSVTNLASRWSVLPDSQERVLAALRFVQEEIANAAPGVGSAAYAPTSPSGVLARASGDDFERTLLLVALLRALKLDADPVLVSSRLQNTLANYQPSPALFDHLIAGVVVDGQTFWLDAADQYQRGPLGLRSWPTYGLGLVIRPGATTLTSIPICPIQPKTTVNAYFTLAGLHAESALKVITVAEGADADQLREHYARTTREDIDRENLDSYSKYYPQIRHTGPLELRDDVEQNRIEITDSYSIAGLWFAAPNATEYHCRLYGVNVDAALQRPPESARSMPWAMPYPVHQIFHAEANLLPGLPVNIGAKTIEHPDFYFRYNSAVIESKLILDYEYRSLGDVVFPQALSSYLQQLDQAAATEGFNLLSLELP
jgi:hypothetical protein